MPSCSSSPSRRSTAPKRDANSAGLCTPVLALYLSVIRAIAPPCSLPELGAVHLADRDRHDVGQRRTKRLSHLVRLRERILGEQHVHSPSLRLLVTPAVHAVTWPLPASTSGSSETPRSSSSNSSSSEATWSAISRSRILISWKASSAGISLSLNSILEYGNSRTVTMSCRMYSCRRSRSTWKFPPRSWLASEPKNET